MSGLLHFVDSTDMRSEERDGKTYSWANSVTPEVGEVQMSNRNCILILTALGYDSEFFEADPMLVVELESACSRWLTSDMAEVVDTGRADHEDGNIIDIGLEPGYYRLRINQIKDCCGAALGLGATHAYFA